MPPSVAGVCASHRPALLLPGPSAASHDPLAGATARAAVASSLLQAEVDIDSQQLVYMPQSVQEITDISIARQVLRLFSTLEDYDDTQNVFANFDIADELMEQVEL